MSRRPAALTIDGETYEVTPLSTTVGLPLGHRLVKALGPTLRGVLAGMPGDAAIDEAAIAGAMLKAIEDAPTELLLELGKAFAGSTKVKAASLLISLGEPSVYDDHFAGRYGLWLKWVIACAKVNFSGFLGSSGNSAKIPAPTATESSA
jgi:hypothetical protein